MVTDIIRDTKDIVWNALEFASFKHRLQRRKGYQRLPYINHPIIVTGLLKQFGEDDADLLAAALLHDVLEDTNSSKEEIESKFGRRVSEIVLEVTDDMSLLSKQRKALQIKHASGLSVEAKKIKIADKTANIMDIYHHPLSWSSNRKRRYIAWASEVVEKCSGVNAELEKNFQAVVKLCLQKLDEKK